MLFQGQFEFDVSRMTEAEKHLISHRTRSLHWKIWWDFTLINVGFYTENDGIVAGKKLESRCSDIVAEVHTRALGAEPSVTTLLEHLIVKHGHETTHTDENIVMRDRYSPMRNDDFLLKYDDFLLKYDDFLLKYDDFLLKYDDFLLKNVGFTILK